MSADSRFGKEKWRSVGFRLIGLLPLAFFLARVIEYVRVDTPQHILWSCHISNLMMAFGFFFAFPFLIRISAFWQILGLPPWFIDMVASGLITPVSIFSHLGGVIVALIGLKEVGAKRWSWLWSLIYFLILQQITRMVTPADIYMNVNVAHFAYGWMKDWFSSYWKYWIVNSLVVAASLIVIEVVLMQIFKPRT